MDVANVVLEYAKVLLSMPVVIGAIAITALLIFTGEIKTLIGRIATIKLPGGSELLTSQQLRTTEEASQQKPPDVSDEQVPLLNELHLTQEQIVALRGLYLNERANAYLWEYRYLNHFLVFATQVVLDWIASNPEPVSISLLDNVWTPLIRSAVERQAIINALQSHHLIAVSDSLIQITSKGQEYREWRGPLVPPMASNP